MVHIRIALVFYWLINIALHMPDTTRSAYIATLIMTLVPLCYTIITRNRRFTILILVHCLAFFGLLQFSMLFWFLFFLAGISGMGGH